MTDFKRGMKDASQSTQTLSGDVDRVGKDSDRMAASTGRSSARTSGAFGGIAGSAAAMGAGVGLPADWQPRPAPARAGRVEAVVTTDQTLTRGPQSDQATAPTVIGWRYEVLGPPAVNRAARRAGLSANRLGFPFARFDRHGVSAPATCRPRLYEQASQWMAPQHDEPHAAPHPDCDCGYRVVADLDALQEYSERGFRQTGVLTPPMALYRVRGTGRIVDRGGWDDPETTSRVSHMRLIGPVYLPDDRTGRAADRYLGRFTPRPEVWYVEDPRDVWSADLEFADA